VEVVHPAAEAAVDRSHEVAQGNGGQIPLCEFRQSRLDLLQRGVCRSHIRVRLSSLCPSTHLQRKTQEAETRFGRIHDVGLGLVETQAQSVQYVAHHLQRFLYIVSTHHDKVICVAHQVRLQCIFAVSPLPGSIQNVQIAVSQQRGNHSALRRPRAVGFPAAYTFPGAVRVVANDRIGLK